MESEEKNLHDVTFITAGGFIKKGEKFLVLQRPKKLLFFGGEWMNLSTVVENGESPERMIIEKIETKLGILNRDIISVKQGEFETHKDKESNILWIFYPFLIEVSATTTITLKGNFINYAWATFEEAHHYRVPEGFLEDLTKIKDL